MNAKAAKMKADSVHAEINQENYKTILSLIGEAAMDGDYFIDVEEKLVTDWIKAKLEAELFHLNKIVMGWRISWVHIKDYEEPIFDTYKLPWDGHRPRPMYKGDGFGGGPAGPM